MAETEQLRDLGRRLLEEKEVALIIGYGDGGKPVFVTDPDDAERLSWGPACKANLAAYLTKPEIRSLGKPGVVLKGCDARSLMTLILENQVVQEDVVVIGVGCEGIGEPKCKGCQVRTPGIYDHLVGEEVPPAADAPDGTAIDRLEAMTPSERWDFWQRELERCTKCYACRAVCPLCYCGSCFVDQTRPAWTSSGSTPRDNFVYHLFRAFHLAGRCSGCGECQRACPQGIPLGLLNRKVARDVARIYGGAEGSPLLRFDKDDPEDFIR